MTLTADAKIKDVQATLKGLGLWTTLLGGQKAGQRAIAIAPHSAAISAERLARVPGVAEVFTAPSPHPRIDALAHEGLECGGVLLGAGQAPVLMAGPCSVESEAQIQEAAAMVAAAGARFLRGGALKPRSSPYSFSGHGHEALTWLRRAADDHGLALVTEVLGEGDVGPVSEVADLIQVGSRNMQNFALLKAIGGSQRPVLLKRGMAARVDEWLLAGEHLAAAGAPGIVFCERGIQSYDSPTRNLLDLGSVALLKHIYGHITVVDPSHAAGRRDLVPVLARAALATGADALLIECHPDAGGALSDGPQALNQEELARVGALFPQDFAAPTWSGAIPSKPAETAELKR